MTRQSKSVEFKRGLLAVAFCTAILAVVADASRRYRNVTVLFNSVDNPQDEAVLVAEKNLPLLRAELGILGVVIIGVILVLSIRLARRRRTFF